MSNKTSSATASIAFSNMLRIPCDQITLDWISQVPMKCGNIENKNKFLAFMIPRGIIGQLVDPSQQNTPTGMTPVFKRYWSSLTVKQRIH